MAKIISNITAQTNPNTPNENSIIVEYDNYFAVVHFPKREDRPEYLLATLQKNPLDPNKVVAEQAVLEQVKTAMLLVHTAKALGWKNVNFGNTQEPLSRYILKMACDELGLQTKETVKMELLPTHPAFKDGYAQKAYELFMEIRDNPYMKIAQKESPSTANNDNQAAQAQSGNAFDFDEEAPVAPHAA